MPVSKVNGRSSVDAAVKSICDIMRRGNLVGAMQYVPELSWLLFLRILDEIEEREKKEYDALGRRFSPSLKKPYRWRDWAAKDGEHRRQLTESASGLLLKFINKDLLPHLKAFRRNQDATDRQKVIGQIVRQVERAGLASERNMLDVLNRIDALRQSEMDEQHLFTLSQVYEGLLLKMGERNNDAGQFFTPREVIRAMVKVVNPQVGETVYDPCCGTGGFLAQAHEFMRESRGRNLSAKNLTMLKKHTFYGREKETMIYPIALANLVLHGIDFPRIWHGNTLDKEEIDGSLFDGDAHGKIHDVILTNPPFGGKENRGVQSHYDFPTGSTQVLFLQEVIDFLKVDGRCGMVIDDGLLYHTNQAAFAKTRRRLMERCDLWCIVSLPGGVFIGSGAGVKTSLLFFTKGRKTEKIWYYDLGNVKVTKRQPLTLAHFDEFFRLLPKRADSDNSWTVSAQDIEKRNYDLHAINPNKKTEIDARTPDELMSEIEKKGREMTATLADLRAIRKAATGG